MGVLDDIKDHVPGSDSGDSSGSRSSSSRSRSQNSDFSSDLNTGENQFGSDSGGSPLDNDRGGNPLESDSNVQRSGQPGNQRQGSGRSRQQGSRRNDGGNLDQPRNPPGNPSQNRNQQPDRVGQNGRDSGFQDSPNPQTGRPQPGDTEPQLSRQTERKMENAGLENEKQSVADRRDEIQQLNSKMDTVIELLKRLNQNMEAGSSGRHGGRR